MPWGTIAYVGVIAAIAVLTVVAVLAAGVWERHPLRTWRPERDADPPMPSPYADVMNAQAGEHGFTDRAVYRLTRTGRLRFRGTFWFAPGRTAIAVVAFGGIGPLKQRRTLLVSRLGPARFLVTSDDFGEADLADVGPPEVLLHADFGELVARHWDRLDGTAATPEVFSERTAEDVYHALEVARRAELTRRGRARELADHWRYTFGGAVRLSVAALRTQVGSARYLRRATLARPGDAGYTPRYAQARAEPDEVEAELIDDPPETGP